MSAHPQRQIISRIPLRGMTPEEWPLAIEIELIAAWKEVMSEHERENFCAVWPKIDLVPPTLFVKLDWVILHQTQTLGWRISLCELVKFRFSQWDSLANGPELYRKLGAAFARSARIMQRKELPPVEDSEIWAVKQETVKELRRVLQIMRTTFSKRRTRPAQTEVVAFFTTTVSDPAQAFSHLYANLDRWLKFFEENPQAVHPLVFASRPSPAMLYDDFHAWATGWQPEALRQATSELRPKL
jgi:hypothetical protein